MLHKTVLTQPSVWLLSSMLSRPRWAKTEGDAYRAARIATVILPDLDVPDKVLNGVSQHAAIKAESAWCTFTLTFSFTDRQRDCIKTCLRAQIAEGNLVNGPWSLELLTTFGLAPDEDVTDEKAAVPVSLPSN